MIWTSGIRLFAGSIASAVNRQTRLITTPVYQVRVLPEGEQFACPADQPILNAAHAADILISYSCRGGQCGSCLGRVITGETSYPEGTPAATSAAEARAGRVLFCSAYATSDLVIEIIKPEY